MIQFVMACESPFSLSGILGRGFSISGGDGIGRSG